MKVGDYIECWTKHEVYQRMMKYAIDGIMTDIAKDRPNTLIVKEIRGTKEGEENE